MANMKLSNLTRRDIDILNILNESEEYLNASSIASKRPDLTLNTVQVELRKLLKMGLVEIGNIGYSGTVLCREYKISQKASKEILAQLEEEYSAWIPNVSASNIVAGFFKKEKNQEKLQKEISELEKIIEQYKK
ncbi:MAG: penicillinase repressor [Lachnospiraceae bacterium]|nr:penicillinase repressor [Lachnospiraceae bacterium]